MEKINKQLRNTLVVKFIETSLREICHLLPAANLLLLDVSINFIIKLETKCFVPSWQVQILSINDNLITYLEAGSFHNLSQLKFLNISNNPLSNLPQSIAKQSFHLKLFYIVNVSLKNIDFQSLIYLPIKLIITNDYHLCCISSNVTLCPTYKPWYFSCDDILPKISMNILFKAVSVVILILNTISIIINILTRKESLCHSMEIIFINLNDMLCGLYLVCIWISDIVFKDKYSVNEISWRSGPFCMIAFGIILMFTILTQFLLSFFSLTRLMVVIHPIDTKFKISRFVFKSIVVFYITSTVIATSLTLIYKLTYEIIPTSLCLPFVDPTNSHILIKVITLMTIITQTLTSVAIVLMHFYLLKALKESKRNIRKSKSAEDSDVPLIIQLVAMTTSNIICWFPTNGIYIAAMFLYKFPTDLIIWTVVVGLPVNSIINPSIFLLTFIRKYVKSRNSQSKSNVSPTTRMP